MSMKTSTRQVDGVTIVDCSGRITLGEGSVTLRDTVHDLLSKGQKRILLNLGDVNYIDSSGLAVLINATRDMEDYGGIFMLAGVRGEVRPILETARLENFFLIYPSVDEALAAP